MEVSETSAAAADENRTPEALTKCTEMVLWLLSLPKLLAGALRITSLMLHCQSIVAQKLVNVGLTAWKPARWNQFSCWDIMVLQPEGQPRVPLHTRKGGVGGPKPPPLSPIPYPESYYQDDKLYVGFCNTFHAKTLIWLAWPHKPSPARLTSQLGQPSLFAF